MECNIASFRARLIPLPFVLVALALGLLTPRRGDRSMNSVARKYPFAEERGPHARLLGQRDGTTELMALRDECSPLNIMSAPEEEDVLTKTVCWGFEVVETLYVEANPDPPWGVSVVEDRDRERADRMLESICCGILAETFRWESPFVDSVDFTEVEGSEPKIVDDKRMDKDNEQKWERIL